jgi:hypothetical protein
MDGEKNIAAKGGRPLRPRRLGQLPTSLGAFCGGLAREKASSRSGEVTSEAKSEGLSPYTITALPKNLPYFFKKLLYRLDFRRLFCYNS